MEKVILTRFTTIIVMLIACQFISYSYSLNETNLDSVSNTPNMLGEVVVTAKPIRHTSSGYVATLDQDKVNGRSLSQVLSIMPFIQVGEDEINVLSRKASTFYIDGMKVESYEEIKMLPTEAIEKIAVEYASGVSGDGNSGPVIRITLRHPMERGYFGQIWAGGKAFTGYGFGGEKVGAYFSTQQGPLRITAWGQYDHRKLIGRYENDYSFPSDNNFSTRERYDGWQKYPYGNVTLWWQMNENNSLGASFSIYKLGTKTTSDSHNTASGQHDIVKIDNSSHYYNGALTWNSKFSQSLSLEASASYNGVRKNMHNAYDAQDSVAEAYGHSNNNTDLFKFQAMLKFAHGASKWGIGANAQRIDVKDFGTKTMFGAVPDLKMGGWQSAGFASYDLYLQRLTLSAGLRLQNSRKTVHQADARYFYSKTMLCPSVNLTYLLEPERGSLVNVEYKRTMEEMPYSTLSSYPVFLSPQAYSIGNPDLKTPFTDMGMVTVSFRGIVNLYGLYQRTSHPIYYSSTQSTENAYMVCNMAKNGKYEWLAVSGLELILPINDKISPKLTASYKMMRSKNADFITPKKGSWDFGLETEMNFTRTFGGNLSAHYETSSRVYDMRWGSVWSVDFSLYKYLFKNKLRLSLDCTPYSKGRKVTVYGTNMQQISRNITKNTSITLTARVYIGSYDKMKGKDQVQDIQEYHIYDNPKNMH